jgi:hypothetical protein
MRVATHLKTSVLIALFGAGCGGGKSSPPPMVSDFCSQRAMAECQVASRCGASLSMAECQTGRASVCMQWAGSIAAPRVFTPGNIASCVNMAKSVYAKTSPITPTDLSNVDNACNYVFQGMVAMLMPCTVKYDCASNRICDKGKCGDSVTKNKGDQCSDVGAICATGSFCQMATGGTFSCVAKGGQTQACDASTPCLETLRCVAAKCTDRAAAGAVCTTSDDCAAAAPYCDALAGGTCDMGLLFAPGSASCTGFVNSGVTAGTAPATGGGQGGASGGAGGASGGQGGTSGGAGGSASDASSGSDATSG